LVRHPVRDLSPLALALVISLCLAACVSPRGEEARELLLDIAAGSGPSWLKETTPEPSRIAIRYRRSGGAATADLYRGSAPPSAAVVVVPGLTPDGKDDPRLVAFANSLARTRFLVLVPEIPNTRALKVSAADSVFISDAIEELAQRSAAGTERRVGLVAISYAVGPALLAASQTSAGRHVGFIVAIGGYYDVEAAIAFVTTGYYRAPDGSWQHATPNEWGKWIFLRSNADRITDRSDRDRLLKIADRKLTNPAADIADLVASLGLEGRAVYQLIANRDPEQVPVLVARLPEAIPRELRRLDLKSQDLRRLTAPLIIVHGRDDAVIPYSESVKLAEAVGARAEFFLIDHFAHVDAGATGFDSLRLWNAAVRVLEERDRGPAASSP
jgi:pimeloyl-ACP methyl ester carboxylesterase